MFDERTATDPAAKQVLRILDEGRYQAPSGRWVDIGELQSAAEHGTSLYTPDALDLLLQRKQDLAGGKAAIDVIDATTQKAARRYASEESVALLNFASARNPGGGFLGGARAQEEELCRCSGLYRALITQPMYYRANREQPSLLYTDYLIYSPAVPFIRVSAASPFLEEPFVASVITTPAPNRGALEKHAKLDESLLSDTFVRRWLNVLAVAQDRGHRIVILGAWGCGAFRNDPEVAARTAATAIFSTSHMWTFDRIVFAIPGAGQQSARNLAAFQRQFAG